MERLALRLRVFLFFCLIGLGGTAVVLGALWLGYRQLDAPGALSAFATVAIAACFGLLALSVFVWRLFDENVSKPIESLSAQFRVRADAGVAAQFDTTAARYLGDLAPAASVLQRKLEEAADATENAVTRRTEGLERQLGQLLRILSDIPVAVIVATPDHQIVLYDGQAADLMEREAPARLNGSVFDYLDEAAIREHLAGMETDAAPRREIAVAGISGRVYSGHMRRFGANEGYTLMLTPLDPDAARPLVYDFGLLDKVAAPDLNRCYLRDLSFVVFDSETTGLNPDKDEVVQLGAVRIVNGRIVPFEAFDRLVNPGRPIPPGATRVHHIDDTMVAGAPGFAAVRADFHAFARGAVLVAHNAPFDMAFLHRAADGTRQRFDNPVLDTVHLSAVVFGGSAVHTLDALCERLNVPVPPELRHTGLGDARATAEAFVAMLPILEARGLATFGALKQEIRKHSRILKVQD